MGSGAGSFLKVILKNFDVLAGPVVSLVYPLYASVRAIETKSPIDDQQWLTYWVLYSLITLTELTFAKDPDLKDVFSKPDDILTAAEKYIEENGPDAFEKIIHRADKSRRNDNYAIFS
ncbi:hypothetical protein G4B88_027959 [Cannabis sativa]|uniref:HVA22-like protein n=1 Tax=Cannabis sativa TaxID=3483 RepID=A0A7J6I833_CANSA|nr:hypothetical protein G4B88_027959 [Cannabis sativa]